MAGRVDPRDAPQQRTSIPNKLLSLLGFWNADTDKNDKIAAQDLIDDVLGTLPSETDANTAYKDRVKSKVLWTGPLSVISTPTSLDGAEKFSDWDIIEVHIALTSDTDTTKVVPLSMSNVAFNQIDAFDNTGRLRFRKLTDTTFEIAQKTVSVGNISRVIGISL